MELTNLIASGAQADFYLHNGFAVKLFKSHRSKTDVFYEALIQSCIENCGLPVPVVNQVTKIENRWAIYMNYIEGPTIYDLMIDEPNHISDYLEKMVDLQIHMHTLSVPSLLSLKDRLRSRIASLSCINQQGKSDILNLLANFPSDNKLCHGDFHPKNLIKNNETLYIIDWVDATNGLPEADVCRSYMLLSLYFADISSQYLDTYCRKSNKTREDILKWLPIIAAARLSDNFKNETETLMKWIENI